MKMRIAAIVLFVCVSCTSASFWKRFGSSTAKQDCKWTSWARTGLCFSMTGTTRSKFKYGRRLTREKIKEKNGGKECSGSPTKLEACSDDSYVAATFLRTITSALPSLSSGTVPVSQPNVPHFRRPEVARCAPDFVSHGGKIRMAGKPCGRNRRKREVVQREETARSRTKRNTVSTNNRDVLFLIDESGSVGTDNFQKFLRLAKAVSNSFCGAIRINKTLTRVGVLSFDASRHPRINFDEYFAKATLISEIGKIKYSSNSGKATCLVDALQYSRSTMISPSRGARVNVAGTERMVILMTDGCANCKSSSQMKSLLKDMGQKFTKQGIPIFTFLVTPDASSCFNIMKGLAEGRQCYEQFNAETWAGVDAISVEYETSPSCMDSWKFGKVKC